MATAITLSWFGPPEQRHVVKVPPMQTLGQALAAAASKFRPPLDAARCSVLLAKRPLDLATPFRLLNVPAGSKLEVVVRAAAGAAATGQAGSAATAAPPPARGAPAAEPAAAASAAAVSKPAPPAASAPAAPDTAQPAAPPAPVPAPPARQPAAAAPAAAGAAAAAAGPGAAGSTRAAPAQQQEQQQQEQQQEQAQPSPLAALGVTGPVYVFTQQALEAAGAAKRDASAMELDPPDEFFELTPDDLVRLSQSASEKKQAEGALRPRALREAEAAARARALGPVCVRLHFPEAIVQASFAATQQLAAVQQLVRQCAVPELAPALYLYTTPPKTVLRDPTATLYQLQLVPAAHLYVGCDASKLPPAQAQPGGAAGAPAAAGGAGRRLLRAEALALMQDSVPEPPPAARDAQPQPRPQQGGAGSSQAAAAEAQRVLAAAAAASRAGGGGGGSGRGAGGGGGGGKVPKWMKMGGK